MSFLIARRALAVVALSLISFAAHAHGSSRQKVVEKIKIDAPSARVWGDRWQFPGRELASAVTETEGSGGDASEQAKRELTLKSRA